MKIPKYNRTNNVDTTMLTIGQKKLSASSEITQIIYFLE